MTPANFFSLCGAFILSTKTRHIPVQLKYPAPCESYHFALVFKPNNIDVKSFMCFCKQMTLNHVKGTIWKPLGSSSTYTQSKVAASTKQWCSQPKNWGERLILGD